MRLVWIRLLSIGTLVLCLVAGFGPAAHARLLQETLASGETLYKSLRSLQDNHGYSWQLIAFKTDAAESAYLRVVGFPTVTSIDHSVPLVVRSDLTEVSVSDQTPRFGQVVPPAAVGQYSLASVLQAAVGPARLTLIIPTRVSEGDSASYLHIPKSVAREWWAILKCKAQACRFDST